MTLENTSSLGSPSPKKQLGRNLAYSLIVILIMATTLFFFCPRFAYWELLHSTAGSLGPESNRARSMLKQLDDPFAKIENPSNVVIQWRLLFPIIGHTLHLPPKVFFALPYLGCFLTLLLILYTARRETKNLLLASLITAIAASSSWFFVSTGWLGYFDSFYILGSLLVSFYRPRWLLLLCCLLVPWVNERFILGLPLAMTLRAYRLDQLNWANSKQFLVDILLAALFIAPFLAVRLLATKSNDQVSGAIIQDILFANHFRNHPEKLLSGSWHGLRLSTLGFLFFCYATFKDVSAEAKAFLTLILVLSIYLGLAVAGDVSRNISLLLPAVILGLIQFANTVQFNAKAKALSLSVVLGLNFILPAKHCILSFDTDIYAFPHEWEQWKNPPIIINPAQNLELAKRFTERGQFDKALFHFSWAISLDPNFAEAYFYRGLLQQQGFKQSELAKTDLRRAQELAPKDSIIAKNSARALLEFSKE